MCLCECATAKLANYFRFVLNTHLTKSTEKQTTIPDKVRHAGVRVINSTEA